MNNASGEHQQCSRVAKRKVIAKLGNDYRNATRQKCIISYYVAQNCNRTDLAVCREFYRQAFPQGNVRLHDSR